MDFVDGEEIISLIRKALIRNSKVLKFKKFQSCENLFTTIIGSACAAVNHWSSKFLSSVSLNQISLSLALISARRVIILTDAAQLPVCTEKNISSNMCSWLWTWKRFVTQESFEAALWTCRHNIAYVIFKQSMIFCSQLSFRVCVSTMVVDHEESRTRYRRTQSVTRAEEITSSENKQRKSQPDKPWVSYQSINVKCCIVEWMQSVIRTFRRSHRWKFSLNQCFIHAGALTAQEENNSNWKSVTIRIVA